MTQRPQDPPQPRSLAPTPDSELAPTVDADGSRKWIYPDRRNGPHASQRRRLAMVLMMVYLAVPWISIGGQPLLRFDVLGGRLCLAGSVLALADASWLAFLLVGLGVALLFVTALKGRVWCGYACPQTVFVEWLIRPIEELIEGSAHHRRIVDRGPWTLAKAVRKFVKHIIFMGIAVVVANVFLAYFIPPTVVLGWIGSSPAANPIPFAIMLGVVTAFYGDLAWFREQFCSFLCPYARFQAVVMDKWTPVVTYDHARGEPRGRRATGACIDCGLCQRVCPTGIDIRNGLQLECISCNRCSDACDQVMGSLGRPTGLIRTVSQGELEHEQSSIWRRPRVWFYGLAMMVAFSVLAARVWLRDDLQMHFARQSGTAYSHMGDGRFANYFTLRAANEGATAKSLHLMPLDAGVEIICGACATEVLAPHESRSYLIVVILTADAAAQLTTVRLKHEDTNKVFDLPLLLPGPTAQGGGS